MADWRKLSVELCLADGVIDEAEVKILKKALYQDGKIDAKELDFLVELRSIAQKKAKGADLSPAFENFFFKAVYDSVITDGVITGKETNLLRKALFADKKIDEGEKKLLKKLKTAATKTSPLFDKLCEEVLGG